MSDIQISLRDVVSMPTRIIVYQCPRCKTFIPAKTRAKSRFDSVCPRCHRRVQIWWPSRKRSVWDDRRGAKRTVSYWPYHTLPEARTAAKQHNFDALRMKHQRSLFKFERMDAGFVPASRLTQKELSRIKRALERLEREEN